MSRTSDDDELLRRRVINYFRGIPVSEYRRHGRLSVSKALGVPEQGNIRRVLPDVKANGPYDSLDPDDDPIQKQDLLEEQRLRNEISGLRAENKRLKNWQLDERQILSSISAAAEGLPVPEKLPSVIPTESGFEEETAVLVLSDAHIGRTIDAVEMEGMNAYDFSTFADRYWKVIDKAITITRIQRYAIPIHNIHVLVLGDMFNDYQRPENQQSNEMPELRGVLLGANVLAQGLSILTAHFDKVTVSCVVGNEPRTTMRKQMRGGIERNLDWLGYQAMSLYLKPHIDEGLVEMNIPKAYRYLAEIMGHRVLIEHGDDVFKGTGGYGGVGWYSLFKGFISETMHRMEDGGIDCLIIGHKHPERLVWDNTRVNGSICGGDEYARTALKKYSIPTQMFFGVSAKRIPTWEYSIHLDRTDGNSFVYDPDFLVAAVSA